MGVRTALSTQYITVTRYLPGSGGAAGGPLCCTAGRKARTLGGDVVSKLQSEPFLSGLYFGECPRWHEGRLWYSDFFDHAVFSVSSDGNRRVEVDFDGEPGGLGWLPDGRLIFASRLDRVVMRREDD